MKKAQETKKANPAKTQQTNGPKKNSGQTGTIAPRKSNWQQQDKSFHEQIATAKKSFIAGGGVSAPPMQPQLGLGKITPLPPGKPVDPKSVPAEGNVDKSGYIQCPHCGRKFEQTAAAKHIPHCDEHNFNKKEKDIYRKSLAKVNK